MSIVVAGPAHSYVTSGTSTTVTLNVTQYDIAILAASINGYAGGLSVSSSNISWSSRYSSGSTGNIEALWEGKVNNTSASETVTISWTTGPVAITIDACKITGINFAAPNDTNGTLPAYSATSNVTTAQTTAANTVVFAAYRLGTTASPTAGSGWSTPGSYTPANYHILEYEIFTSAQSSITPTLTTGAADQNGGIVDAFVAAASCPHSMLSLGVGCGISMIGWAPTLLRSPIPILGGAALRLGQAVRRNAKTSRRSVLTLGHNGGPRLDD